MYLARGCGHQHAVRFESASRDSRLIMTEVDGHVIVVTQDVTGVSLAQATSFRMVEVVCVTLRNDVLRRPFRVHGEVTSKRLNRVLKQEVNFNHKHLNATT